MSADEVVLLTGFPSLLSRTVCAEVVQSDPRARVRTIVRAKFEKEANAFLDELPPTSGVAWTSSRATLRPSTWASRGSSSRRSRAT